MSGFESIMDMLPSTSWVQLISDQGNEFRGAFSKMLERYQATKGIVVERKVDRTTLGGNRVKYASQVERFNRKTTNKTGCSKSSISRPDLIQHMQFTMGCNRPMIPVD